MHVDHPDAHFGGRLDRHVGSLGDMVEFRSRNSSNPLSRRILTMPAALLVSSSDASMMRNAEMDAKEEKDR